MTPISSCSRAAISLVYVIGDPAATVYRTRTYCSASPGLAWALPATLPAMAWHGPAGVRRACPATGNCSAGGTLASLRSYLGLTMPPLPQCIELRSRAVPVPSGISRSTALATA